MKTRPRGLSVALKHQEGEPESTAAYVKREIRTPRRGSSDENGRTRCIEGEGATAGGSSATVASPPGRGGVYQCSHSLLEAPRRVNRDAAVWLDASRPRCPTVRHTNHRDRGKPGSAELVVLDRPHPAIDRRRHLRRLQDDVWPEPTAVLSVRDRQPRRAYHAGPVRKPHEDQHEHRRRLSVGSRRRGRPLAVGGIACARRRSSLRFRAAISRSKVRSGPVSTHHPARRDRLAAHRPRATAA